MKVQRWIGLMAAALMLHANAKVAFAACVVADPVATAADDKQSHPESDGERLPGGHSGSTHHHEQASVPEETPSSGDERGGPSDAPPTDDCCQEMNSCGSSVILNQGAVRTPTGLAAAAAISGQSEVLLGRTAEPEPPPPKA